MAMWAVPAVLAVLGIFLFFRGLAAIAKGKAVSGGMGSLTGGLMMAAGAAAGLLGLNIQTYQRLAYEQPVAEVHLKQKGASAYVATLRLPNDTSKDYDLLGDEWQIDARVLKWKPWANVAGFDASYRLERLAGRYHDVALERSAPRSVYALSENPGLDLWSIATKYGKQIPVVDATYGSATYVPAADGAVYYVTMSQSGLLARPANDQARAALQNWK